MLRAVDEITVLVDPSANADDMVNPKKQQIIKNNIGSFFIRYAFRAKSSAITPP
jgi:hypothetical protein